MTRLVLTLSTLLLLASCASTSEKDKPLSKENVVASPTSTNTNTGTSISQKVINFVKKRKPILANKKPAAAKPDATVKTAAIQKQTPGTTRVKTPTSKPDNDLWARLRMGFDLPDLKSDRVSHYENYFTRRPQNFYTMLQRAEWFLPYILTEVEKRNFPTEIALLPAVESAFVPIAKSRSAASGLWQFIPSTGRIFNLEQNKWYDGRRDPVKSTQAALDFFEQLDNRFDGNWFHSIAAYNAGGRTLELAIAKRAKKHLPTDFIHLDLRRETQDYVPKLIAFRNIFLAPEKYGLTLPKLGNAQRFATLDAGSQIDLNLFMSLANVDRKTFKFLNSAYYRNVTPPKGPHILHVPIAQYENAKTKLAGLSTKDRLRWAQYVVKNGDTLDSIAKHHGMSVTGIKQNNKLKSSAIQPGKALMIPASAVKNAIAQASSSGQSTIKTTTALAIASKVSAPTNTDDSKLTHKVRRGDTLWAIAQRYGVKVAQISSWNQINKSRTLHLGQELTIYTRS